MKKHARTKMQKTPLGTLLFGIVFSFLMLIVSSIIGSAVLMVLDDPTGNIEIVSFVLFLLCGAISGFAVSRYKGDGGIVASILSSLISVIIMLLISLVASKGKVGGAVFMNYLCYVMLSALFAYLGRKKESRRAHRR